MIRSSVSDHTDQRPEGADCAKLNDPCLQCCFSPSGQTPSPLMCLICSLLKPPDSWKIFYIVPTFSTMTFAQSFDGALVTF